MGFLDNLAKYNASKAGGEPAVNPPEASAVLATTTAAEVANEKAATPSATPLPATALETESAGSAASVPNAQPSAPESSEPKTKTRRSRTNAAASPASATPESADITLTQAIELVACLLPSGSEIKITGRG